MNFVLKKAVRQYILAVRIVVIQAGLLLLDWKAVPFQQTAIWDFYSFLMWMEKKNPAHPI